MRKTFIAAVAMLLLGAAPLGAKDWKIKGNSIRFENTGITVLSPTMFCVQDGANYRFAEIKTDLGVVSLPSGKQEFSVSGRKGKYTVTTPALQIDIDTSKPLLEGRVSVEGCFVELGGRDTRNLGGMVGALDNCDGEECYSEQNDITSSHYHHPTPDNGLLSRRGYTVLAHNDDLLSLYEPGAGFKELFVLCYGSDYRKAYSDFVRIAGKSPMFPKWSTGLIWSRWKDYTDKDYYEIIKGFRSREIPLDAVILDMCWHVDNWYGYRYDTSNFPNMKEFLDSTEAMHVKVGFNHHSGCIWRDDPKVREFCRIAGLDYESSIVDGPSFEPDKRVVQYDTRNERHFRTFYDLYLKQMIADGFDFHWVDGANSIYSAELYNRYLSEDTGKRPFVLNRQQNYTLCNHRYPAAFSGDTYATWATLARELEVTVKGANCLVWWSHDIGGYMPQGVDGYIPDAEMFARWCQFGAFSPILRFHAKKDVFWYPQRTDGLSWDGGSRLPWDWGPTAELSISNSIRIRASLNPYIYSCMHIANVEGTPLCRGMYIDYPLEEEAYTYSQYKFGDAFVVAPVTRPSGDGQHGTTPTTLWLPAGTWYDLFTGERVEGGSSITRVSDIFSFPVYVAEGSIVPTTEPGAYVDRPLESLTVGVFAFAGASGESSFDLYEDSGDDFGYEKGLCRLSTISYAKDGGTQCIELQPARGSYPGAPGQRELSFCITGIAEPASVSIDGVTVTGWTWADGVLKVPAGSRKVSDNVKLVVK